jgi:broad specificity phosphatase PhoE
MKHVYFVRHGESDSNVDGIHRGRDAMLTEQGHAQAASAAARVAALSVEALISSPFPRAVDTARAIESRTGLPVVQEELFAEWEPPSSFIGQHRADPAVREAHQTLLNAGDRDYRHEDEETFSELSARAQAALAFLEQQPSERLCVVTHGGLIVVLAGVIALQDSFSKENFSTMFRQLRLNNTGITYARYDPDKHGWQLVTWNDQAHLG